MDFFTGNLTDLRVGDLCLGDLDLRLGDLRLGDLRLGDLDLRLGDLRLGNLLMVIYSMNMHGIMVLQYLSD